MRAATRRRYGGPEVVEIRDVPTPSPGSGEVLVRVHATTVNRTDCAYRSGRPWINRVVCGWPRPRVQILGSEYAGTVAALGKGVTRWAEGERVFGFVDGRPGAHAELLVVAADGLIAPVPAGMEVEAAAPAMEGAFYAHAFLRVTGLGRGHRALVHGATGTIGTALVQLLRAEGVEVTAVCDRRPTAHPDLLEELGAAHVIDLSEGTDLRSAGGGFDAVIDATGHLPFATGRPLLRPGGSYSSSELGRGGQNLGLAAIGPVTRRLGRRHVRFPYPSGDAALAAHVAELMTQGAYRPVVDRTHDFADLREAYAWVDTGRKVGSVVVRMPST
ncbi:quinone oxidoreductase family protein [Janibacter alittae]|uniref:NAD(P)-dependent alcohol dehydrogenase n=1 Tax=Janibacter alittae TaxID=3115209 RepID=A0ABZ2MKY1_9MICO